VTISSPTRTFIPAFRAETTRAMPLFSAVPTARVVTSLLVAKKGVPNLSDLSTLVARLTGVRPLRSRCRRWTATLIRTGTISQNSNAGGRKFGI